LRAVYLEDVECSHTLEFLRTKGNEVLREVTGNPAAILVFEYAFTPPNRGRANYQKKNVPFGEVLHDVLSQFGLSHKLVGMDRIVITDSAKPR